MTGTLKEDNQRWLLYGLWIVVSLALFWRPGAALLRFALENDNASHIVLIPFISDWVIFMERRQVFRRVFYDLPGAAIISCPAAIVLGWTLRSSPGSNLIGYALTLTLLWITGFVLIFGRDALKIGRFSFLFLFLMVPLPDSLLKHTIYFLQKGSAEIASALFDLTGVPVLRDGFIFHLPRVSIEVASECSGIRSSMALFILALLVGHFFLRSLWKQIAFVLCGLLVMIVKNGIRIVTLTLLANYVDPGFLFGNLHHKGGVVFFLLGLLLLVPVLWLLQRGEPPLREDTGPDSRNFENTLKT